MLPAARAAEPSDDDAPPNRQDLAKKTIAQLKELCTDWSLPRGGNKSELLARLMSAGGPKSEGVSKSQLAQALPVNAGPWMKRCVQEWKLAAPYNTAVSSLGLLLPDGSSGGCWELKVA